MKKVFVILLLAASITAAASDSHQLSVQALTDVDGKTDVSILIDAMPGYSVPQSAKHIQLKSFNTEGKLQWTENEHNVDLVGHKAIPQGNTTLTYFDMLRYQPVAAQVQIKNEQTQNTEVLNTKTVVLNRPDFAIDGIKVPHYAYVGEIVNIPTLVRELNGDLGATSTMVLSANGETLDVAHGINLTSTEAADVVFSAIFEKPGVYTLTATVKDIYPGDFDYSNNSSSVTLEILDAPKSVNARVHYSFTDLTEFSESYTMFGSRTSSSYGQFESFGHTLILPRALDFPIEYARFNLEADGNYVTRFDLLDVEPTSTYSWGCTTYETVRLDLGNKMMLYISSARYKGCDRTEHANARIAKMATNRHFFSESHSDYWGDRVEEVHTVQGEFISATKEITSNFIITDNDESFGGKTVLPITTKEPYRQEWDYDYGNGYFNRGYFLESGYNSFFYGPSTWNK